MKHLLSRKFLLTAAGLVAGSYLAYLGKLDAATAGLIGTLVAAYNASNVTQKATGKGE